MARLASSRICSSRDAATLDVAAKSQKAKKPGSHEAKQPRSQEANKPRSRKAKKPKSQEAKKTEKPASHTKARATPKQRKNLDPLKDLSPKRHKHKTRSTNRSRRLDTKQHRLNGTYKNTSTLHETQASAK